MVHGHTISDGVDERPNRIGIDTGAYRTGVLTALGLEGERAMDARYRIVTEPERAGADALISAILEASGTKPEMLH